MASAPALLDYFLKIEGIAGESMDSKHKGEIDVESWSWGANNTGSHATGSGGGAGKVQMQDFHFTMKLNKASPSLFLKCATGEHLKEAVISMRKAGGGQHEFLKVTLSDLLVSSYQTGGATTDDLPTDQFALNFAKIEFDFAGFKTGFDQRGGTIT